MSNVVLFKDVDEYIDTIILNISPKSFQGDSTHQHVKLGYRLSNIKLSTLHFSYSKVMNYTVTLKGLEEQLLSSPVKFERRELEKIFENTQQEK